VDDSHLGDRGRALDRHSYYRDRFAGLIVVSVAELGFW
jgi:hypothetical protein